MEEGFIYILNSQLLFEISIFYGYVLISILQNIFLPHAHTHTHTPKLEKLFYYTS